jgi:hypothetical protein
MYTLHAHVQRLGCRHITRRHGLARRKELVPKAKLPIAKEETGGKDHCEPGCCTRTCSVRFS